MRNFDASYDMDAAKARREAHLACFDFAGAAERCAAADQKDADKNAAYVALRLSGLSADEAFEKLEAEAAAAFHAEHGRTLRNFEIEAYNDEPTLSLEELVEQYTA